MGVVKLPEEEEHLEAIEARDYWVHLSLREEEKTPVVMRGPIPGEIRLHFQ